MITQIPFTAIMAQQAHILTAMTARVPRDQPLWDQDLQLRYKGSLAPMPAPVSEELEAVEDGVVEHLGGLVPKTGARLLVYGQGTSKTDPVYALRLLAKLAIQTGRTGEAIAYDQYHTPEMLLYFEGLPWSGHRRRMEQGRAGNFEMLRGGQAHLILSIHPGRGFEAICASFDRNLARGGIGLVQGSVLADFSDEEGYGIFTDMVLGPFKDRLELFRPPVRSRLYRSYFAERSEDVHLWAVRKLDNSRP